MVKLRLKSEKRLNLFFLFVLFSIFISGDVVAQTGKKITSVVIDAGHGGGDPGAVGKRSKEKDITLSVALKTGEYIKQYCPDVNVIIGNLSPFTKRNRYILATRIDNIYIRTILLYILTCLESHT